MAVNVGNILTRVKVITSLGMEERESAALTFLAFVPLNLVLLTLQNHIFRLKSQRWYQDLASKCHVPDTLVLGHN